MPVALKIPAVMGDLLADVQVLNHVEYAGEVKVFVCVSFKQKMGVCVGQESNRWVCKKMGVWQTREHSDACGSQDSDSHG